MIRPFRRSDNDNEHLTDITRTIAIDDETRHILSVNMACRLLEQQATRITELEGEVTSLAERVRNLNEDEIAEYHAGVHFLL